MGHRCPDGLLLLVTSAHLKEVDEWSLRRRLLVFWSVCSTDESDNHFHDQYILLKRKRGEREKEENEDEESKNSPLVDGNVGSTEGEKDQWGRSQAGDGRGGGVCPRWWAGRRSRQVTPALGEQSEAAQHVCNFLLCRVRNNKLRTRTTAILTYSLSFTMPLYAELWLYPKD